LRTCEQNLHLNGHPRDEATTSTDVVEGSFTGASL
jgi:hypothetical protein